MSENLRYWDKFSRPPKEALKAIQAGRLKGKSDINPQWRMKAMTETFGPVGIGWKYSIDRLWLESGNAPEICAFALVSVQVKDGDQWSESVPGIGGSSFVTQEKNGPFTSDEAFKMAVTDALSVAFKALGVAAEVYMGNFDGSKYRESAPTMEAHTEAAITKDQVFELEKIMSDVKADRKAFCAYFKVSKVDELPAKHYASALKALEAKRKAA